MAIREVAMLALLGGGLGVLLAAAIVPGMQRYLPPALDFRGPLHLDWVGVICALLLVVLATLAAGVASQRESSARPGPPALQPRKTLKVVAVKHKREGMLKNARCLLSSSAANRITARGGGSCRAGAPVCDVLPDRACDLRPTLFADSARPPHSATLRSSSLSFCRRFSISLRGRPRGANLSTTWFRSPALPFCWFSSQLSPSHLRRNGGCLVSTGDSDSCWEQWFRRRMPWRQPRSLAKWACRSA
jgi:hypothetical protein